MADRAGGCQGRRSDRRGTVTQALAAVAGTVITALVVLGLVVTLVVMQDWRRFRP